MATSMFHGEALLFLTDEQLRQGIEAMFFAYRGFTADPDRILDKYGYGVLHHRAIHFINCVPGTTVNNPCVSWVLPNNPEPCPSIPDRRWIGRSAGCGSS